MQAALSRERLEELAEPILVLEMQRFRRRGLRLVTVMSAILLASLPMLVLFWHWNADIARIVLMVGAGAHLFAGIVMIPAYGGRSISRERETGSWDMLAMTPVKSSRIADQKIVAAALPLLLLWAAGLPVAAMLAFYGGVSLLEFVALEAVLVLHALAVSAWSVQASNECGPSAQAVAYLPASSYVCGCAVYLPALVLLLCMPALREQVGRLCLGGLCVQAASGAAQYFVWTLGTESIFRMTGSSGSTDFPAWAIALIVFAVASFATVGMRYILAWSVDRRRSS